MPACTCPWQGHQSDEEEDTRQPPGAAPEEATPRHRNREDDFYDTDDSFIDDDDLVRARQSPCRMVADQPLGDGNLTTVTPEWSATHGNCMLCSVVPCYGVDCAPVVAE